MKSSPLDLLSEKDKVRFNQYMELFIKFYPKTNFHQKDSYQLEFVQKKKKDKATPLYLFKGFDAEVVARHLDHNLWWEWKKSTKSHYLPRNPIWLALNAPRWVQHDVIDVDAKEYVIGYRSETTKVNDRIPIVFLKLAYFQKLKFIYDHFPDRIWCISSESLGMHIWRKYGSTEKIGIIQSEMKGELVKIGLGSTEVHPMPGRPFRRPFGLHYRTITSNGTLTTWQDQVDYFVGQRKTTSFTRIAMELLKAMMSQVKMWESSKYKYIITNKEKNLCRKIKKIDMKDHIKKEIVKIHLWISNGCPLIEQSPEEENLIIPEIDVTNKSGWYHQLVQFAIDGLPEHDSIGKVVYEFAKWLYWIDLFELPEEKRVVQIYDILHEYILSKDNGYVTRLNNGNEKAVFNQIKRMIRSAAKISRNESLALFERIRNKIENNRYKKNIRIVDILTGKNSTTPCQLTYMCMPPKKLDPYTPLPEVIEEKIKQKQGLKKVFPFANVLLNKIASSGGKARVGRKWFTANGFKDPNKTQERIDVLIKAGVLRRGTNYSVGRFGLEYSIPPKVMELFRESSIHADAAK